MKHWMTYVKAAYEVIMMAEEKSLVNLEHEVEAFVVHTFARYMEKPTLLSESIAIKLMDSTNKTGEIRKQYLQEIAEECMLVDGLELNFSRWPTKHYYSDMGKLALAHRAWSERPPELFYEKLAYEFGNISRVLHAVKA